MKKTIALLALATIVAATAVQGVPALMSFQGVIKNDDGTPVPDGIYEMDFRIYDAASGGAEIWFEEHRLVEVVDSTIFIALGEEEPLDILPFDAPYWLGIAITGEDEMLPRIQLTSAPYALQAGNAEYLGWRSAEAYADTAHMHHADHIVEGVLSIDRIPIGHTADDVAAGDHYHGLDNMADVDTMGLAVGRVLAYDGGMWRPSEVGGSGADDDWTVSGNDVYSSVNGNVGIGTATPGAKLDVQGNVTVGTSESEPSINFWGSVGDGRLWWDGSTTSLRFGIPGNGSWAPGSVGQGSFAAGHETMASGAYSAALGQRSRATGPRSFAAGYEAVANGDESMAFGWAARADTTNTFAAGTHVRAIRPYNMVLGSGLDEANPLVNDVDDSMVIGFGATTPALFVGGPHNRVGIGTTTPDKELEVNGTTKTDGFVMSTGAGDGRVLTSDAGGYGTWQTAPRVLVASDIYTYAYSDSISDTMEQIGTLGVQFVAPTSGTVVVQLVANVAVDHDTLTMDDVELHITKDLSTSMGLPGDFFVGMAMPTELYRTTITAVATESVTAGTHNYYGAARMNLGANRWDEIQGAHIVATFYPD